MEEQLFDFIKRNKRAGKPRHKGLTEIRGPYYSVMGANYLTDVLETMGDYVDALKFAGGSFTLMRPAALKQLIDIAHQHQVEVSTGGFVEYVLTQGNDAVKKYIDQCKQVGFDIIELSSGFITLAANDWLQLVEEVHKAGLKAKPEVGIQFGAGGATSTAKLEEAGNRDIGLAVDLARQFLEAGVYMIMIESEGITENTDPWRTDVISRFRNELDADRLMFEAAEPAVFEWYIKNYGPDINLFVDHSQIVQLECLRAGIWGTRDSWGRIQSYSH